MWLFLNFSKIRNYLFLSVSHFTSDSNTTSQGKADASMFENSENGAKTIENSANTATVTPSNIVPKKHNKIVRKPKKILKKTSDLNKLSKGIKKIHILYCINTHFIFNKMHI